MQSFMQQQQEQRPRALVVLALKVVALALAVADIVLAALRAFSVETLVLLLAVGLVALSLATIMDTRIVIPRYVQQQPPPVPRQQRRKKKRR